MVFIRPGDAVKVPESERRFFDVPVRNFERLEREIAKLSKRSQKAGGWSIDLTPMGTKRVNGTDFYEVFLDAPDVRLEGYQFLARLDHSTETGNVIRMLPDAGELPEMYRTVAPLCDHCRVNRMRRDTFILRKDADQSLIQLGSSCMEEFFATDPRAIMKLAELLSYTREAIEASQHVDDDARSVRPASLRDLRYLSLHEYLVNCAVVKRLDNGRYFNASYAEKSTREKAFDNMFGKFRQPVTPEDEAAVEKAMEWVEALAAKRDNGGSLSQFEHNILVVGLSTVIEGRSAGLAAAIVGCYDRQRAPFKADAPKAAPLMLNNMLGVLNLFAKAGAKLQWPKITISFPDTGEVVLSVAGPTSQYPGSINVKSTGGYDAAVWYGRIHTDGRWEPTRSKAANLPAGLEAALAAFAADPAGVAAAYGHRTGQCCFCHKKLKDQRSAAVGYGATCAKNYDLPYGVKAMRAALAA